MFDSFFVWSGAVFFASHTQQSAQWDQSHAAPQSTSCMLSCMNRAVHCASLAWLSETNKAAADVLLLLLLLLLVAAHDRTMAAEQPMHGAFTARCSHTTVPRPSKRLAAASAAESILNLSDPARNANFAINNYPPLLKQHVDVDIERAAAAATHSAAHNAAHSASIRRVNVHRPQWLWPVTEALCGLQRNCAALGVQVGQAVAGGPTAGVSLHASRSFARGQTVGYFWGVLLEEEHWIAIREATAETAAKRAAAALSAGLEDYWTPAQQGLFRCLAVPMQNVRGVDHLLASEQCPMAYVNQAAEKNANLKILFPEAGFEPGSPTAYAHVEFVATRPIAIGEELLVQYAWENGDTLIQEATKRYNRFRASLAQRPHDDLSPFDRLRAHDGRFACMIAVASTSFERATLADSEAAAVAAVVADELLPTFVPVAVDGRMETFVQPRFMMWVPPSQHSISQLCDKWLQATATQAEPDLAALGLLESMRNGGNQLLCRPSHPLHAPTVAAMREVLEMFVGMRKSSMLRCAGVIALTMKPGDGPMPYHADQLTNTPRNCEAARKRWSVLLYTSDTQATALPRLTEEQMDQAVDPHQPDNAKADLLQPSNFFAGRVRCGSTLVMRSDVPHASVKHHGSGNRLVLYALFSAEGQEQQMTHAYFPLGVHA